MLRAPSPAATRADAVRAHVAGEALCDAGRVEEGVRAFKAAKALAWELDGEEWPAWARELYDVLSAGGSVVDSSAEPTMMTEQGPHPLRSGSFSPRAERGDWWRTAAAVDEVVAALHKRHFAVIDGFAGSAAAARMRGACEEASHQLKPASDRSRANARSDQVTWEPAGFEALSQRTDALVTLLRRSGRCGELEGVASRQRLMFSRYAEGDFFARHVDNDCARGKGRRCSPRVLTAVYYLQSAEGWDARADGGCLRLFRPECVTEEDDEVADEGDDAGHAATGGDIGGQAAGADALVDIAPVCDRLVLFYSDQRCPHEVLPVKRVGAERWAATIWYMGDRAVPEWWAAGTAHDSSLVPLCSVG